MATVHAAPMHGDGDRRADGKSLSTERGDEMHQMTSQRTTLEVSARCQDRYRSGRPDGWAAGAGEPDGWAAGAGEADGWAAGPGEADRHKDDQLNRRQDGSPVEGPAEREKSGAGSRLRTGR